MSRLIRPVCLGRLIFPLGQMLSFENPTNGASIQLEIRLFKAEAMEKVWVHDLLAASLVYEHSLDVRVTNSQLDN